MDGVLREGAERAIAYLVEIDERPVRPELDIDLCPVGGLFPDDPTDPSLVVKLLDEVVSPATMAKAGPRFFGWVIGGGYPVALAADWLCSAWDQNTAFASATPGTVALERAALHWVIEAAGLPPGTWGAFVTETTIANVTALAAACS